MSSKIWRRTLPVVLAGLLALLPVASFAGVLGWDTEPQQWEQRDHGRPMSVLTRAWEAIVGIWGMVGAGLDPHGNPGQGDGSSGVTSDGDVGATIDPHG